MTSSGTDYFPRREANYPAWFSNFSAKFGNLYAAQLGMTDKVEGLQNDTAMVNFLVEDYKPQFDTSRTTVTAFANQMLSGGMAAPTVILPYPVAPTYAGPMVAPNIVGRTRKLVAQIKSADGYTEAMGHDMGLVAPDGEHEMTAPELEISALPGLKIRVKWLKGKAGALELLIDFGSGYPRRGQRFTRTPFEAEVELPAGTDAPATITVKARYIVDDNPTGDFGPEYTVTVHQ